MIPAAAPSRAVPLRLATCGPHSGTSFRPDREIADPARGGARLTVFVIEDHAAMRRMLVRLLGRENDLRVVGEAASAEEALDALERLAPAVVLVDMSLPGMSGLEFLQRYGRRPRHARCLVVSAHREEVRIRAALAAGARGYLSKNHPQALPDAIRRVGRGEREVIVGGG